MGLCIARVHICAQFAGQILSNAFLSIRKRQESQEGRDEDHVPSNMCKAKLASRFSIIAELLAGEKNKLNKKVIFETETCFRQTLCR